MHRPNLIHAERTDPELHIPSLRQRRARARHVGPDGSVQLLHDSPIDSRNEGLNADESQSMTWRELSVRPYRLPGPAARHRRRRDGGAQVAVETKAGKV